MKDIVIVTQADRVLLGQLAAAHEELRAKLERAIVVSSEAVPPDVVTMNSRLFCREDAGATGQVVSLVYPRDADQAQARISVLAPAGIALLGCCEGQELDWDFADGARRRMRIEHVLHQPERSYRRRPLFSAASPSTAG